MPCNFNTCMHACISHVYPSRLILSTFWTQYKIVLLNHKIHFFYIIITHVLSFSLIFLKYSKITDLTFFNLILKCTFQYITLQWTDKHLEWKLCMNTIIQIQYNNRKRSS